MPISIEDLNSFQLDILKEIGNIGAGNAATSLSMLLNRKIDIDIPVVKIMEFKNIPAVLGGADNIVAGVLIQTCVDLDGFIMYTVERKYARILVGLLMQEITDINDINDIEAIDDEEPFNEIELSALSEITNILAGSYLGALAQLTNMTIDMSEPSLAIDMAGAILSVPASVFGELSDSALFLETSFIEFEKPILGHFFLIPALGSFEKLLEALGVTQ